MIKIELCLNMDKQYKLLQIKNNNSKNAYLWCNIMSTTPPHNTYKLYDNIERNHIVFSNNDIKSLSITDKNDLNKSFFISKINKFNRSVLFVKNKCIIEYDAIVVQKYLINIRVVNTNIDIKLNITSPDIRQLFVSYYKKENVWI